MSTNQLGYFAKQVANDLEVTKPTLRRWSVELEKQGYAFSKNQKGQRVYYEHDYKPLRELKNLIKKSVPFTSAIAAVSDRYGEGISAQRMPSDHENLRLSKRELEEYIQKATDRAARQAAEETAQAMQEKLRNEVERRDRIVTERMNQIFEQKEIATAKEKTTEKKKWWEFWK